MTGDDARAAGYRERKRVLIVSTFTFQDQASWRYTYLPRSIFRQGRVTLTRLQPDAAVIAMPLASAHFQDEASIYGRESIRNARGTMRMYSVACGMHELSLGGFTVESHNPG